MLVGLSATKGWSSVDVSVDGSFLGTLRMPVDPRVQGCEAIGGQRLLTEVSRGAHTVTAVSNVGRRWTYTTTVPNDLPSDQCWVVTLLCDNDDCSPTPLPSPQPLVLESISLNPSTVQSQGRPTATATLTGQAPSGGASVLLSSSNTDVAKVPSSVFVAAGQTSNSFGVDVSTVSATTSVTITGSYGGVSKSAILTVTPPPTPPPPAPPQNSTLAFEMGNACNETINLKFFDKTNNLVWPSSSSHYPLAAGSSATYRLNCMTGASICFGGSTTDGRLYWGVGVDGSHGCQNCCYSCSNSQVSPARLSCGSTTPPPVPLPQATCVTNPNGATTWTIHNDTQYTLQVDFSGAASRTLTLAPRATQTFNLAPGRYNEFAQALGVSGVSPWSGSQTIASGQSCGQRFFIESR